MTAAHAHDRDRRARYGLYGLVSLGVVAALAVLVLALARPTTLALPGWAVDVVEARLNRVLGGSAEIDIAGAVLRLPAPGVAPGIGLVDVVLRDAGGGAELSLPRVTLAPALAGRGDRLTVDGARLTLRRGSDGRIALDVFGAAGSGVAAWQLDADTVTDLAESIARVLRLPGLDRLDRIDVRGITLFVADARLGQGWEIDDGDMAIRHGRDRIAISVSGNLVQPGHPPGSVMLSLDHPIGTPDAIVEAEFDAIAAGYLMRGGDAAPVVSGALSGRLRGALGPDGSGDVTGTVALGPGRLRPAPEAAPVPIDGAQLHFAWDPVARKLSVRRLEVSAHVLSAALSGEVWQADNGALLAQVKLDQATANPKGVFAEPLRLSGGGADLRIAPGAGRIEVGQVWLTDGVAVWRGAGGAHPAPGGMEIAADFSVAELPVSRLLALWPQGTKVATREWIARNVEAGMFRRVAGGVRIAPGAPPRFAVSFDVTDLRVHPLPALPVIADGSGQGSLTDQSLELWLAMGTMTLPGAGDIALGGTRFSIPDITVPGAPAEALIAARGGLSAALALLDHAPFRFLEKGGFATDLGTGQVRATATIGVPLAKGIQFDDVTLSARAELSGVTSDSLVPGRTLRADRLAVTADNDTVEVAGDLTLDALPVTARWRQPLGKGAGGGSITGTTELSPRFLETFGIALPPATVAGRAEAALTLDLPKGAPARVSLQSDLAGLRLSLLALDWTKPSATGGSLTVEGTLGSPARFDRLALEAPGLSAEGQIELRPGGALDVARFDRVRRGGWLDAGVTLTGQGPGRPVAVALTGGRLDLREASFGSGGAGAAVDVRLDRVELGERLALSGVTGQIDTAGGVSGRLTGRVNGGARVAVTLAPGPGGTDIRVLANDAGAVLRSARLVQTVTGGTFDLFLRATGGAGNYRGQLALRDIRVRDAPTLAGLLSAISVVGLLEQLDGEGLVFSHVDADFSLSPGRLQLRQGSATGPSIGLSAEGVIDTANAVLDLQGVFSPVYLLNGVLQQSGMFGGLFGRAPGEGILGFSYTLRGPAAAPQVAVNPLSVLAPGVLRQLFRGPVPGADGSG